MPDMPKPKKSVLESPLMTAVSGRLNTPIYTRTWKSVKGKGKKAKEVDHQVNISPIGLFLAGALGAIGAGYAIDKMGLQVRTVPWKVIKGNVILKTEAKTIEHPAIVHPATYKTVTTYETVTETINHPQEEHLDPYQVWVESTPEIGHWEFSNKVLIDVINGRPIYGQGEVWVVDVAAVPGHYETKYNVVVDKAAWTDTISRQVPVYTQILDKPEKTDPAWTEYVDAIWQISRLGIPFARVAAKDADHAVGQYFKCGKQDAVFGDIAKETVPMMVSVLGAITGTGTTYLKTPGFTKSVDEYGDFELALVGKTQFIGDKPGPDESQ